MKKPAITLLFIALSISCLFGQKSIQVELKIDHVSLDGVDFAPSFTKTVKLKGDEISPIFTIEPMNGEDFGVRFIYYQSLQNVSFPGDNPEWKKSKVLEIEFYKKENGENNWNWFSSSTQIIDEEIGDDEFTLNSFDYNDYQTNREYGFRYDYRVK